MNNLFLINNEEKDRILNLHESATKRQYLSEQPTLDMGLPTQPQVGPQNLQNTQGAIIKKGNVGDPYVYGKMGDDYYYAKSSDGDNPNWVLANNPKSINSIKGKIYNEKIPVINTVTPPVVGQTKVQPVKKKTQTSIGSDKFKLKPELNPTEIDNTRVSLGKDRRLDKIKGNKTNKVTSPSKNGGFMLIWAFPEYQPKIDGKSGLSQLLGSLVRVTSGGGKEGTYGKLGHGGCIIISPDGNATCYEFGRYPGSKKGYGKVLSHPLGRVGKIKDGQLLNPKQVSKLAKQKTYPPGPTMSMTVAVVKLPNPSGAIDYASVKQREYSALDFSIGDEDANCGTFNRDVAKSGGIQTGSFCFPTPISVVNSFKDQSDSFFQV